jgi:hypothetical protein
MRPWFLALPLLLLLAGCQTTPSSLPVAEPSPSAECRWPTDDGLGSRERLRRAVAVLEARDFRIRDTDLALGLVSAERTRIVHVPDYYDDRWDRTGVFGGYGRGGFSGGMVIGLGSRFGRAPNDATRLERLSLLLGAELTRVSRDLQVIDWRGEIRQSRNTSDADFCRGLRADLETAPGGEERP